MICRTMPFSMIHNPDFKGTPLFDVEYLRNGAHRDSYNGILTETYTRPTQRHKFEWL